MKIRNARSIMIILIYTVFNVSVIAFSFLQEAGDLVTNSVEGKLEPDYTFIENLDYFHLLAGVPQMSLAANRMKSQGEETAEFEFPRGVYNMKSSNETLRYQGHEGIYKKNKGLINLKGDVKVFSPSGQYLADALKYYFKKDLLVGTGNVKFDGVDPKSKDLLNIESDAMRANPERKLSKFKGRVKGFMERKKKHEGKIKFSSDELQTDGIESLAELRGNVNLERQNYFITAGKGDIYLENFNKSLKYFVFNDDVKVTETLKTAQGVTQRKAFSERLEGFGREEKMVLSGAPRVEQGEDVIKGYRITTRQNVDLIEVDDAMSDVQVKRTESKE